MKTVIITLLALLTIASLGLADEHRTTPTVEGQDRQAEQELRKYKRAYRQEMGEVQAVEHEMKARKRKHLDQLRTLKLLELLDLDEDQELEFIHVFQSMRRKHRELNHERMETIEDLVLSLEGNSVTSEQIASTLGKIDEIESGDFDARRRFLDRAGAILSPDQMGKLIVFHAKFEHEILNQLREFRGRGMERGPQGQTGGPSGKGEHMRRLDDF